jgi:hypothetical protein
VPISVLNKISRDSQSSVYQYVIRAVPIETNKNLEEELTADLVHSEWNYRKIKSVNAKSYREAGFNYFWNAPELFRRYFCKAFLLENSLKILVYVLASFFPFRVLKYLDGRLAFATYRRMVAYKSAKTQHENVPQ